ncbi:MAG: hypothetical protein AAGF32_09640, partial [Pseudomonadota bacterium]
MINAAPELLMLAALAIPSLAAPLIFVTGGTPNLREAVTLTREIRNQGGAITTYTLENIPEWVNVFPREGTLAPGAIQEVTFEFPANLPASTYATDLILQHVDGPEPLPINLRVA